jgi:hypothetical protein
VTFTLICAFIAVEDFTDSCRKVYFATDDFSLTTFIVVNAGLYYLFQEKFIMMNENDAGAAECMSYHHMCRDNFETGLANLPFFLPPTMESVAAGCRLRNRSLPTLFSLAIKLRGLPTLHIPGLPSPLALRHSAHVSIQASTA